MNTPTLHPATRSRWMNWKPKAQILEDRAESEPTKTTESVSVVFVGATSAESPEIEARPYAARISRATELPNRDRKPEALAQILEDRAASEPTKTTESVSVVFVGATSAESPEIEARPYAARISRATELPNRDRKPEALAHLADRRRSAARAQALKAVLRGKAVLLAWNGETFWLVADESDAAKLGEPRGQVYTAAEAQIIIAINDTETVAEVHQWKRRFDGRIREALKP